MDDWVDVNMAESGNGPANDKRDIPIRSVEVDGSSSPSGNFYKQLEECALKRLETAKTPIFHIDLGDEPVYTTFVKSLAPEIQQQYECSTCRHFANHFGDLALVNDDGTLQPLLWSESDFESGPEMAKKYMPAVRAIQLRFSDRKATSEFKIVEKTKEIGTEQLGGYNHMRIRFPATAVRKAELPGFTSANTPELAAMLQHVLADYKLGTVRKAYTMLKEDKLPHADNHKASAKWLLDLIEENKLGKAKGPEAHHNLLYRYAASSFIGSLKQMRSGVLGTLLEDVRANRSWKSILASWQKVTDPTAYMRPQVAPSAGNIKAAERLFEQLGLTKEDLKRRLLVQDDVPEEMVIWSSEAMKTKKKKKTTTTSTGVFDAVTAKEKPAQHSNIDDLPATKITFSNFVNKVLPNTKTVHCWLDTNNPIGTFITGFEGTKPLMQWHDDEGKNLASQYFWTTPPAVEKHNLKPKAWNEVRCLIPFPWLWDGGTLTTTFPLVDPDGEEGKRYKYYHKQKGFRYLFVLEENHESNLSCSGLFPEYLKSELHGVRSTIEAFANTASLHDVEDGMARGGFVAGVEAARGTSDQNLKLRVRKNDGDIDLYHISLFE